MADADQSNLTVLTVDLLSAFVANNTVEHAALPELIKSTHAALKVIDAPEPAAPEEPEHKPAVTIRKSLSSDSHIISLIDGKPYQTLKRHLSKHGLTADQYRERYNLPASYPLVSKAYSASRRAIAEKLGLGGRIKGAQATASAAEAPARQSAAPNADTPAKPKASSARAAKTVAAQADRAAPSKVKAAPKPGASAKAGVPVAAKAPARKATATAAGTRTAIASAKPAPKARKAVASKQETLQAPASAKPAPRKRGVKAATPTT